MASTNWVYIKTEPRLWTVGFYSPDGKWHPDTDWGSKEEAAQRVHYLNGDRISNKVTEHTPKCVIKQVGKIILSVAETAERQPGSVIRCSSVALRGWADAYIQLETSHADLLEAGKNVLKEARRKWPNHRYRKFKPFIQLEEAIRKIEES